MLRYIRCVTRMPAVLLYMLYVVAASHMAYMPLMSALKDDAR